MGLDFYKKTNAAKQFYDNIPFSDEIKRLSFHVGEEELTKTSNTQPTMIAFQLMVTNLLERENIVADAVCGLSIGEYGALYAAKVLSLDDTIKIAKFRGLVMEESSNKIDTAMYAIINSNEEKILRVLEEVSNKNNFASISNINLGKQYVISGQKFVVEKAVERLKADKFKTIKLKVSGPFHTEYMNIPAQKLREKFENITFNRPTKDIYLNFTGKKYKGEDFKEIMTKQIKSTVRFGDCIDKMISDGVDLIVEIGFNKVIEKMIKKSSYKVDVIGISTFEEYKDFVWRINGK